MADEQALASLRLRYAKFVLGLVYPEDLPSLAWDALEAGLDGPAILRMAALDRPSHFEVRALLPAFWAELGIEEMSEQQAAIECAKSIAAQMIQGSTDLIPGVRAIQDLMWRAGYPSEIAWAEEAYVYWHVKGRTEERARFILSECANLIGVPVPELTSDQLARFLHFREPLGANFHLDPMRSTVDLLNRPGLWSHVKSWFSHSD